MSCDATAQDGKHYVPRWTAPGGECPPLGLVSAGPARIERSLAQAGDSRAAGTTVSRANIPGRYCQLVLGSGAPVLANGPRLQLCLPPARLLTV